ncbi:MAG: hypothetical protein NUV81_02965 [bacterium]|nr:hypothetical protein [bacterium]
MPNGPEQTTSPQLSGFQVQPSKPPRARSNIVLVIVLIVLIGAVGVVGFLVLKRQGYFQGGSAGPVQTDATVGLPPGTTPLDSYIPERPWQEGDPVPENNPVDRI